MPAEGQEHPGVAKSGITFAVDSVLPATKPIWSETLADSLELADWQCIRARVDVLASYGLEWWV